MICPQTKAFHREHIIRCVNREGGGGTPLPEKLGGSVRPTSQNPLPYQETITSNGILTLFMTKIYDISYPIYDLTKNLKPYL